MKKKKETNIECLLCRHYGTAKVIHSADNQTKKLCKEKGIEVRYNTNICDLFEVSPFFFCVKEEYRIHVSTCNSRYKRGHKCKGCKQGEMVNQLMENKS